MLDYIASAQQSQITQFPADDPTPSVEIGYDGWVSPNGGVAFVWTLEPELEQSRPQSRNVDDGNTVLSNFHPGAVDLDLPASSALARTCIDGHREFILGHIADR